LTAFAAPPRDFASTENPGFAGLTIRGVIKPWRVTYLLRTVSSLACARRVGATTLIRFVRAAFRKCRSPPP